uniref:C2H2-type domain-containing protein n=1 Tax=Moniliophthora roreri TaxID=221103 RepID=A0A0W0GDF8_MONRR
MTTYYTTLHTQTPASQARKISLSLEDCISQVYASLEQKDSVDSVPAAQVPPHTTTATTYTYTQSNANANLDFDWTFPSIDTMATGALVAQQQQFAPLDISAPSVQAHVAHEDWNPNLWWGAPVNDQNQSQGPFDYVPQQQQQHLLTPAWTIDDVDLTLDFNQVYTGGVAPSNVFAPMEIDQRDLYLLPLPDTDTSSSEDDSEGETYPASRPGLGKARALSYSYSVPIPEAYPNNSHSTRETEATSSSTPKHRIRSSASTFMHTHEFLSFRRVEERCRESLRRKLAKQASSSIQEDIAVKSLEHAPSSSDLSKSLSDTPLVLRCYKASCPLRFDSLSTLTHHTERQHHGMVSYRCPFGGCDLVAGSYGDIGRHEQCLEHCEKGYRCLACLRGYTRVDALKRHWVKMGGHKTVHEYRVKKGVKATLGEKGVWVLDKPNGYTDSVAKTHALAIDKVSHKEIVRKRAA